MKKKKTQVDFMTYFRLIEDIVNSDETDMNAVLKNDEVRKKNLYSRFKKDIEKIRENKHKEVDREIKELNKRVDRLFSVKWGIHYGKN